MPVDIIELDELDAACTDLAARAICGADTAAALCIVQRLIRAMRGDVSIADQERLNQHHARKAGRTQ